MAPFHEPDPLEQARIQAADQANIWLNQRISHCRKCQRLAASVCRSGGCADVGAADAKILVIGETLPVGKTQGILHHAMDGSDGYELLQQLWLELGVDNEQVFYINAVNCAGNQIPNPSEIKNCREYLDYAIRMLNPLSVILMGPMAMNAYWPDRSFHESKGKIYDLFGIPALVTYHPQHIYDFADLYGKAGSQALISELKAGLDSCLQIIQDQPRSALLFSKEAKTKHVI